MHPQCDCIFSLPPGEGTKACLCVCGADNNQMQGDLPRWVNPCEHDASEGGAMTRSLQVTIRFAAVGVLLAACLFGTAVVWSGPAEGAKQATLEAQYAKAQLRVAELNLQKLKRSNQRLARTVPADVVGQYQQDVEIARLQLQAAESGGPAEAFAVWLRRASANAAVAQAQWKSAVAANQTASNAIDPLDVERLAARAQLAKLQLERGQVLAAGPADAQMQWQMSLLADDVQRLKEELLRGEPAARIYTRWRY